MSAVAGFRRRSTALVTALAFAGCTAPGGAARIPQSEAGSVRAILDSPARLTVFFWPAVDRCSTVEFGVIGAIEQFRERFPDTRVITVVPEDFQATERYGAQLPAPIHRVSREDFLREDARSPFPRIEAWDEQKHLLLFRAISSQGTEVAILTTELERARGFTRPVQTVAERPGVER